MWCYHTGVVTISRQLDAAGEQRAWGPTKTGKTRTIVLCAGTVNRLRQHKREQAVLKLKNRTTYADHGVVFANEHADLTTPVAKLGQPCVGLTTRHYIAVTKAAGLNRMKSTASGTRQQRCCSQPECRCKSWPSGSATRRSA